MHMILKYHPALPILVPASLRHVNPCAQVGRQESLCDVTCLGDVIPAGYHHFQEQSCVIDTDISYSQRSQQRFCPSPDTVNHTTTPMFRSTLSQSTRFVRTPLRAPQAPLRFAAIRPLTTSRPSFHPSSDKPNPHVDPQHLTLKAKDEAKALARDLAGMIGGGQHHARKVAEEAAAGARENVHAQGSVEQDFVSLLPRFGYNRWR